MTVDHSAELAKKDASYLVSRSLNLMNSVDSESLRDLSISLRDKQKMSILEFNTCISRIISKLNTGRSCLLNAEDSMKELSDASERLKEVVPFEILVGSMYHTKLVTDFFHKYQNFSMVSDLITKLKLFNKYLNNIEVTLHASTKEGEDVPEFDFSVIHRMLLISQKLRVRMLEQAKAKSHDILLTEKTLDSFFARLDNLNSEFEMKYWASTRCVFDMLRGGKCETVQKLLDVMEEQDNRDLHFIHNEENSGESTARDDCYNYKKRFFDTLLASIRNFVNNLRQESSLDLPKLILKGYGAIIALLELPEARGDKFSAITNLIRTCIIELHDRLYKVVTSAYSTNEFSVESVIECLDNFGKYKYALNSVFSHTSRTKISLVQHVDSLQKVLCEKYSKSASENIYFHYNSIVTQNLLKGGSEIADADIAKNLENELTTQIENAIATRSSFLITAALELLRGVLSRYYSDLVEHRGVIMSKTVNVTSDFIPVEVEPMLFAMCRDSLIISTYIQQTVLPLLDKAIEGANEEPMMTRVMESRARIDTLSAQFILLARKYADSACSVMITRLKPVEDLLFTAKWYESDVIQFAVSVLTDSLAHTDNGLDREMRYMIIQKTIKEVVNIYINAISTKKCILKKSAAQIIKGDAKALEDTFTELGIEDAKTHTLPIHCLADLVSAMKPVTIASACKSLYESYEGCTAGMLERILESCANCSVELMRGIINKLVSVKNYEEPVA